MLYGLRQKNKDKSREGWYENMLEIQNRQTTKTNYLIKNIKVRYPSNLKQNFKIKNFKAAMHIEKNIYGGSSLQALRPCPYIKSIPFLV